MDLPKALATTTHTQHTHTQENTHRCGLANASVVVHAIGSYLKRVSAISGCRSNAYKCLRSTSTRFAACPSPPSAPLVIVVAFQCRILSHIIIIIASNGALWSSKWFARGAEGNSRCQDNAQQAQQKGQLDCYF